MLKQRLMTAAVMLSLVLVVIFLAPPVIFRLLLGLVILTAAWEWSRLAGLQTQGWRWAYVLCYLPVLLLTADLTAKVLTVLSLGALLWWGLALVQILVYPRHTRYWGHRSVLALEGFLVLIPGWAGLSYLSSLPASSLYILFLILIVAAADSGAYFSGRAFGRRKLAPQVSPNKTWEGVWGGMASCCLLMSMAVAWHASETLDISQWAGLMLFAAALAAISVVGDLFESMIKRFSKVKDSGGILPGHGGFLDRIDGVTAAAPLYVLVLLLAGGQQ